MRVPKRSVAKSVLSPNNGTAPLQLQHVSLRYGHKKTGLDQSALDAVSLRVESGERVAIVGPSGAGKSSILALANTSLAPTTGTVTVFGSDPRSVGSGDLRALRRRIGTVHQQLHLPGPLRVIHNVNAGHLGNWSPWQAWWSLARPSGVDQAREALASLGIADKLWERTDSLSGGERQRVAIARILVQNPDLILADEPISSVDPARGREVLDALFAVAGEGRSLLVSLHAFDLAVEYFDRVIGLRRGRVVFDCEPGDIGSDDAAALYRIDDP